MPARRILQLGDPALRRISEPVADTALAADLFDDLRSTLHAFQREHGFGRAISAVQIGEPKRIIYIEFEGHAWRLRNPEYEFQSEEKFRLWDDCFSFPDLLAWVERSSSVRIRYEDEAGELKTIEAHGALAELLQHEMDHLDGVLAVDRAIGPDGLATREEYARRAGAPPGEVSQRVETPLSRAASDVIDA
jgi:peptide deformylase